MPTRRTVLTAALAGGVGLLAGCTPDRQPSSESRPNPDEALVTQAIVAEGTLLGVLDSVAGAADRAGALAACRAVHEAHLRLLRDALPSASPRSSASASASPAPTATPSLPAQSPAPPLAGGDRSAHLAVAHAEDALRRTLQEAAMSATSGALARVLAGMAAAAAQQSAVLRGTR